MSWRGDSLVSTYRPRPIHSSISSRECVTLRSYTPLISSSRTPTSIRRRASEATVTSLPTSFGVSSYSRYRPTGGTLINIPTIDPHDLPRRYRSAYDRDDYKEQRQSTIDDQRSTDHRAPPDQPEPSASEQQEKEEDKQAANSSLQPPPVYDRQESFERHRPPFQPLPARVLPQLPTEPEDPPKPKFTEEETSADLQFTRTGQIDRAGFEYVLIRRELTRETAAFREIRKRISAKVTTKATFRETKPSVPEDITNEADEQVSSDAMITPIQEVAIDKLITESVHKEVQSITVETMLESAIPHSLEEAKQEEEEDKENAPVQEECSITEKRPQGLSLVEPEKRRECAPKKKKIIIKKKVIVKKPVELPVLPDVVMQKVLTSLNYRDLCRTEVVCKHWHSLVVDVLRREIQEITIERLGSSQIIVVHQPPFRRLSITCPADNSYDFLTGVVRRSRLAALKLTTDMHFLANIDKLSIDLASTSSRLGGNYFASVEDLWLLVVSTTEEEVRNFERVVSTLFGKLGNVTLQCHVHSSTSVQIARCISSLQRSYASSEMSVEIHADTAEAVYDQLAALEDLNLYKVKIICTEFESPDLSMSKIAKTLTRRRIRTRILTFRDWSMRFEAGALLTCHPLDTLRLSSCDVTTVEDLVQSMIATEKQDAADPRKTSRIASKEDLKPSRKRKLPFIKRFEIAGQCRLRGLEFLMNKAHQELEKRFAVHFPLMEFDHSEIYYFE